MAWGADSKAWGWARAVTLMTRLGFGTLFLGSGLSKFQQPYDFLIAVYNYQLVGSGVGHAVAAVLPWIEVVTGVALLAGIYPSGAMLLTLIMLAGFTVAKASAVRRNLRIGCGCQVLEIGDVIGVGDVVLSSALLLAAIMGYVAILRPARPWAGALDPAPLAGS